MRRCPVALLISLIFLLGPFLFAAFGQNPPHPKIVVKAFDATPLTVESRNPYSPRRTCGTCHDYDHITNAYHFQQGRTDGSGRIVMSHTLNPKLPWNLSSGMFGKHRLVSADSSQLAKKANRTPSEIDKSAFYFVQYCGSCHPGGGWGESDRNGNLYYNEDTQRRGSALSEESPVLDGDYTPYTMGEVGYGSPWNESGTSEADCLICHVKGYQWEERAATLREKLFRYGPTLGAGWGKLKPTPEGSENPRSGELKVDFTQKEVADFENLHLQIVRKTPDENCWACHATPDGRQRGQQWSTEADVHKAKGLNCLSCHPTDKDHNFAKGDSIHQTVRDDLDNTMSSCEDCHYKGKDKRAPKYRHPFSPRHMRRIACQTCHIPFQTASADLVYDLASTGATTLYVTSKFLSNNPVDPSKPLPTSDPAVWYPFLREYKGRIVPVKPLIVVYWGDLDEQTNSVKPLFLWKIRDLKKPPLKDDNADGTPEVNSLEEIKAFLVALKTNDKFGNPVAVNPVLVKGGFLYRLDRKGEAEKIKHEQAESLDYSLSHNVISGPNVIGAQGCKDCHSKNSPFFLRKILTDPYDEKGKPVYVENWERLGIDKARLERLLLEP